MSGEAALNALERMGKDCHTGVILGPGCALDAQPPADNIYALVEAAKKCGKN